MNEKPEVKQGELYKDGICECKANMKGKHIWFNEHMHPSYHFTKYMCIRCNKPVYYVGNQFR